MNNSNLDPETTDFSEPNLSQPFATLGRGITKDILDYLDAHPDEEFTNTEISKAINRDYVKITQTLYKLKKEHRISNPFRGFWKAKPATSKNDIINSEAYHNIKIHNVTLKPLVDFDPQGGSHKHVDFYLDEYSNFYIAPVPKNLPISNVTIKISLKGIIYIGCSKYPMTLAEFYMILTLLYSWFPNWSSYNWELTQIGLNKDYKTLRMEGQAVSFTEMQGQIARMYNKDDLGLRREIHLNGHLPLRDALDVLSGKNGSNITNEETLIQLSAIREDHGRLSSAIESLTKTNHAIISKLNQLNLLPVPPSSTITPLPLAPPSTTEEQSHLTPEKPPIHPLQISEEISAESSSPSPDVQSSPIAHDSPPPTPNSPLKVKEGISAESPSLPSLKSHPPRSPRPVSGGNSNPS